MLQVGNSGKLARKKSWGQLCGVLHAGGVSNLCSLLCFQTALGFIPSSPRGLKMTTVSTLNRVLWVGNAVSHLQSSRPLSSLICTPGWSG